MRKRNRILVVAATVVGCLLAFAGLGMLGRGASGPIAALLERSSTAVGELEQRVRRRFSGGSRADALRWFATFRDSSALLARPDRILLGAYDDGIPRTLAGIPVIDSVVGAALPLIQVYTAWGDKPDQQFPLQLLTAISDFGSVPVLTWEPWLSDFSSGSHTHLPLRDARDMHGLGAIASGAYDFYVDRWAREAKAYGRPILLRFAHEMNDPYRYPWGPQHNTKEEFIAAWRHVVSRFRAAGASNVLWVWSPHVAYEYWDLYYPGAEWVDWAATGALNYGPIAQWSQWWSFDQIFGTRYARMAAFGKPIMVAEFGSLAVGGDRAAWYRNALTELPRKYPAVRAVLFFHASGDRTTSYQPLDWRITTDTLTASSVRMAIQSWEQPPKR